MSKEITLRNFRKESYNRAIKPFIVDYSLFLDMLDEIDKLRMELKQ